MAGGRTVGACECALGMSVGVGYGCGVWVREWRVVWCVRVYFKYWSGVWERGRGVCKLRCGV